MSVLLAAPAPEPVCFPDETAYARVGNGTDLALRCPDRPYSLQVVDQPALGRVEVQHRAGGDVLHYTANANVALDQRGPNDFPFALDGFTYTVRDGAQEPSRPVDQRVVIVATDANNAPFCGIYTPSPQLGWYATAPIDVEVGETLPLFVNCFDRDGDAVNAPTAEPVAYGALTGPSGGVFTYTPPAVDPGPDGIRTTLTFSATDAPRLPATGRPLSSPPVLRYIRVVRSDNDPTCADQTVAIPANSGPTPVTVRCTDADAWDSIRFGIAGSPSDLYAELPDDTSGTIVVTPRRGFTGVATVAFTATDGAGWDDTSAPATLTVVVEPRGHHRKRERLVKPYLRDEVAPAVLDAVRAGRPVGPFRRTVTIQARVGGASTTLAAGSLRLPRGTRAAFPLKLSRAGHILKTEHRLHGRLTVTVGSGRVSGRADGAYP